MSDKLYNLEQLRAVAAGSEEFVAKMVDMFLQMTPGLVSRIEAGMQAQDWDEVKAAAHKMKPSIDMMGITSLHDKIREIENCAKQRQNLESVPALFAELSGTLDEVYAQLRDR